MDIILESRNNEKRVIEYRRHIHQNPELSGLEFKTMSFIMEKLDEYGIEYIQIPHGGILSIIDSGRIGKTVLLRADIDALPIDESEVNEGGIKKQCVSNVSNVSHACGHDSHTSMLLVALQILSQHKDEFNGKIYGIFEQGEESNGNIFHIIKYFQDHNINYDYCFGIHVGAFNKIETGKIIMPSGLFYAGIKSFKYTIIGKGGHGSRPDLANNPIDTFADIYHELMNLNIKELFNNEKLTYSICHVTSGTKNNIIADTLEFEGTIRFYNSDVGNAFENKLKEIVEKNCLKHQSRFEYYTKPLPGFPVNNHVELTAFMSDIFKELFNEETVSIEPKMSSESYSVYQKFAPGVFINLVTNNPKMGISAGVHTNTFEIDESVLYKGIACHLSFALACLKSTPSCKFIKEKSADEIIKLLNVDLDKIV